VKAITTTVRQALVTSPVRIVVSAESQKMSVAWNDALDAEANHKAAAKAMAVKFDWPGTWYGGTLPDGRTRVFVCADHTNAFLFQ
jgi:hypothetical protein